MVSLCYKLGVAKFFLFLLVSVYCSAAFARHGEMPNRIPEAPPYHLDEAVDHPPPYENTWTATSPTLHCNSCHPRIFEEWNGSMKANAWRDPGWRGAFLLVSRLTSTDGDCDIPNPPDGTAKASINPFANSDCTSSYDTGEGIHTTSGSGSLMDDFCARCHMPTNYVDAFPLEDVVTDPSGLKHGVQRPDFDPTSDNGTGIAFAKVQSLQRNTQWGEQGIFCAVCHTMADSRHTPYHHYEKSGTEYYPAVGYGNRMDILPAAQVDMMNVADPNSENLGYGIGAGAYVLSPNAIAKATRFGPLTYADHTNTLDPYVSDVFNINFYYYKGNFSHPGAYHKKFERSEMCGACHDVTNPMTIKNPLGKWVGGFPIERTYTEWLQSRYADRVGNSNFDPEYKRDCQTCHMQQDFGQPGTAKTLYENGEPVTPVAGRIFNNFTAPIYSVYYTHHFVGANTYISDMIGGTVWNVFCGMNGMDHGNACESVGGGTPGTTQPWPELSTYSFSSSDKNSKYYNAYYNNANKGKPTHHARMAWDRLRNAITTTVTGPSVVSAGGNAPIDITIVNDGAGHNFPTGFPEGRNAWVAVRAYDLATGQELQIQDNYWNRTSLGVGYLTTEEIDDPMFPECHYHMPPGSPDPYAFQMRAVATLGDGCPTLALPYATPSNLVVNANNMPIDENGVVIDKDNPLAIPRYTDVDGDGDLFDDSFLIDTRLRPLPNAGATLNLDRYEVVVPAGTVGPIAVTAAVYYQSFEAQVSIKFLGNLADTDEDHKLEPCALKGLCDGRTPSTEPAVVEGAPAVPSSVTSYVINVSGQSDNSAPVVNSTYPSNGTSNAYRDVVPKVSFNEPVTNIEGKLHITYNGMSLPASISQVSDGTYAIFPDTIFLNNGASYTVTVDSGVCDFNNNCTTSPTSWTFTVSTNGAGDTSIPLGF